MKESLNSPTTKKSDKQPTANKIPNPSIQSFDGSYEYGDAPIPI